jgi:hypothetical protein
VSQFGISPHPVLALEDKQGQLFCIPIFSCIYCEMINLTIAFQLEKEGCPEAH